ncbi:MAG: rubrerythrin family protein [Clostridia bacterium]|nr:rubrerythrin family protein [Clostridia bacterium]
MDFSNSETKKNLLRAFAGESQARNRYTFAAAQAREQNLYVIEAVFNFTAGQEKEHAEVFYNQLQSAAGENIQIDGKYPIDISDSIITLLRSAHHNEYEEYTDAYKNFAEVAKNEGFLEISGLFTNIAEIEKTHGDRFLRFAELLEQDRLFVSDIKTKWMCLNCGFVFEGTAVPPSCPVCRHDRGYFIRMEFVEKP